MSNETRWKVTGIAGNGMYRVRDNETEFCVYVDNDRLAEATAKALNDSGRTHNLEQQLKTALTDAAEAQEAWERVQQGYNSLHDTLVEVRDELKTALEERDANTAKARLVDWIEDEFNHKALGPEWRELHAKLYETLLSNPVGKEEVVDAQN